MSLEFSFSLNASFVFPIYVGMYCFLCCWLFCEPLRASFVSVCVCVYVCVLLWADSHSNMHSAVTRHTCTHWNPSFSSWGHVFDHQFPPFSSSTSLTLPRSLPLVVAVLLLCWEGKKETRNAHTTGTCNMHYSSFVVISNNFKMGIFYFVHRVYLLFSPPPFPPCGARRRVKNNLCIVIFFFVVCTHVLANINIISNIDKWWRNARARARVRLCLCVWAHG